MRAKQWKAHGCIIERDDGQRRWDEAYQFLLQCMIENREKSLDEKTREQGGQNENCALCPCLNHTAATGSDH
jgi:hypothetical protein